MKTGPIVISEADERSIRQLLGAQTPAPLREQVRLQELSSELDRALVLQAGEVPVDVITMHSRVHLLDLETGSNSDLTLVLPFEADIGAKRISVLAPLGTALLGVREGDEIEWTMPGGVRRLRIERVRQMRSSAVALVDNSRGGWPAQPRHASTTV